LHRLSAQQAHQDLLVRQLPPAWSLHHL